MTRLNDREAGVISLLILTEILSWNYNLINNFSYRDKFTEVLLEANIWRLKTELISVKQIVLVAKRLIDRRWYKQG